MGHIPAAPDRIADALRIETGDTNGSFSARSGSDSETDRQNLPLSLHPADPLPLALLREMTSGAVLKGTETKGADDAPQVYSLGLATVSGSHLEGHRHAAGEECGHCSLCATLDAKRAESQQRGAEAAAVVDSIMRVAHRLRGQLSGHFSDLGLTEIRFAVLRLLAEASVDGCAQVDLADKLDQSESSISTLVERMRVGGLIYRLRAKTDRRQRRLMLSEQGQATLARAESVHNQRIAKLLSSFSRPDLGQLSELLARLQSDLTKLETGMGVAVLDEKKPRLAGDSPSEMAPAA